LVEKKFQTQEGMNISAATQFMINEEEAEFMIETLTKYISGFGDTSPTLAEIAVLNSKKDQIIHIDSVRPKMKIHLLYITAGRSAQIFDILPQKEYFYEKELSATDYFALQALARSTISLPPDLVEQIPTLYCEEVESNTLLSFGSFEAHRGKAPMDGKPRYVLFFSSYDASATNSRPDCDVEQVSFFILFH
jgi:hypothetical protein